MKKALLIFLLATTCFLSGNESVVIILNGPSSAGKTSIQKALQKQADRTYLRIGIDTFFDALIEEPDLSTLEKFKKFDQYTREGEYIRGVEFTTDENGYPVVPLRIGPAGDRIICGMHRAIAGYAEAGNNLIVDYILYKESWIEDLQKTLAPFKVFLVKVNAPLEVIEERERSRHTSPQGHARSHYDTVHNGVVYDLEIDTSTNTADECAESILTFIKSAKISKQ